MALFTVLVVVTFLAVVATTVAHQTRISLQQTRTLENRFQSEMAAQAGLQDALSRIRTNSAYSSNIAQTIVPGSSAAYSVQVTRNDSTGPVAAPDGSEIPGGALHFWVLAGVEGKFLRRASALALRPGSGAPPAAFDGEVILRDSTVLDGWDASAGSYGVATQRPLDVVSNTVALEGVTIRESSRLLGNIKIGVGGVLANVVDIRDSAVLSGLASVATAATPIPTHSAPFPEGSANYNHSNGSVTLNPGAYREARLRGSAELVLNPGVYVFKRIELEDTARIRVTGPVTIYTDGNASLHGQSQLNPNGQPGDLKFYSSSGTGNQLRLYDQAKAWTEAEGAKLTLGTYDDSEYFGTFRGFSIDTWQASQVHIDTSGGSVPTSGNWTLRAVRYY